MGVAFDDAPDRPEHIEHILNGLERYNPETTAIFQDYVAHQCAEREYDSYANLALLKLYQFNPHLSNTDTITSILSKALTVFPTPDFSLCLALLPPNVLTQSPSQAPAPIDTLTDSVQRLGALNSYLSQADYASFWSTFRSDDIYSDLTADVAGFEELMRVRIAATVSQSVREVQREVLETWLDVQGTQFERFVGEVCGWKVDGDIVKVPLNKENEAKGVVVRENVKFDQFSRVVKRAYEQSV